MMRQWFVCLLWLITGSLLTPFMTVARPGPDTLDIAKRLRSEGKLNQALKILAPYHQAHPTDLNPAWILAQTAFWAKRYGLARETYELAIWYHPENLYLQVDYANMLVDLGKYEMAELYLENFLKYFPGNSDVLRTLAKIQFWRGNYRQAENMIGAVDSASPEISPLQRDILLAKSPAIGLSCSYFTDDQPLNTIYPLLESEVWLHPLATLHLRAGFPFFSTSGGHSGALWISMGDRARISRGNWQIDLEGGLIRFPSGNATSWTGRLSLEKKSFRHLVTSFLVERKPYFSTAGSVDTTILEYHLAASAGWNDENTWNGQVSLNLDRFPAGRNTVHNLGAWLFAPPLKLHIFDFRFGYGFSYASSLVNFFVPDGTLAEIIASYDPSSGVKGIYYPYFTPDDQYINSALLNIGIHPSGWLDLGIGGNLGFYATAEIPYLYLDTNGNGALIIKKGYSRETFFPFTLNASALFRLSDRISFRAEYSFSRTWFYSQHAAGLHLAIHLWNEKRRK